MRLFDSDSGRSCRRDLHRLRWKVGRRLPEERNLAHKAIASGWLIDWLIGRRVANLWQDSYFETRWPKFVWKFLQCAVVFQILVKGNETSAEYISKFAKTQMPQNGRVLIPKLNEPLDSTMDSHVLQVCIIWESSLLITTTITTTIIIIIIITTIIII